MAAKPKPSKVIPPPDPDQALITHEIQLEGPSTDDPNDKGGRTVEGISQKANPDLFVSGDPTDAQVRARYEAKYIQAIHLDLIPNLPLRAQLLDIAVASGPFIAVQMLQGILGVQQDGQIGPETILAVSRANPGTLANQLVTQRILMICRVVQKNPSQVRFLSGWAMRALTFLTPTV